MRRRLILATLFSSSLSGCVQDPYLRMPTFEARSAVTERHAAEFHDPYPDETMGPRVDSRPREFQIQRTSTRQASDLRGLHVLGPDARIPTKSQAADRSYSESVKP